MAVFKGLYSFAVITSFVLLCSKTQATVLPEERADFMFHSYDGGGITIDGPSVIVRKNFAEKVSVSANYYVDTISSASIDVVASGASRYSEERTETSFSATYLHNKSLLTISHADSDENDYEAKTTTFSISQDFFGDLTTLSMGYSQGEDIIRQTGNTDFEEDSERQNYRVGITQILTPKLIASLNYEGITDEGWLNNPYRFYRFRDNTGGFQRAQEVYPNTRTSDAAALTFLYYLPYRASVKFEYRAFTDDWEIESDTAQITYLHPYKNWLFEFKLRGYEQTGAFFYSDLFESESQDARDFRARDKELSDFSNSTIGIGISYRLPAWKVVEESSITVEWERIDFEYDNFTDITQTGFVTGEEPLYRLEADVIRVYFSLFY